MYSIIGHSRYIKEHWEIVFFDPLRTSSSLPWVSILIKLGKNFVKNIKYNLTFLWNLKAYLKNLFEKGTWTLKLTHGYWN